MPLFKRKKEDAPIPYDAEAQEPVIRQSICTGEMTAGFTDRRGGQFHEYMLLRSQEEVNRFCRRVGMDAETIRKIY